MLKYSSPSSAGSAGQPFQVRPLAGCYASILAAKMLKGLLVILLLCTTRVAVACSFMPGYAMFTPDHSSFELKFDPKTNFIALLPAPKVEVVSVERGKAAPGASCDDAGVMRLRLDWPKESAYKLNEVGFYFRARAEALPDLIFPLEPIAPIKTEIKGRTAYFTFVWLDGHPKSQTALEFSLDVFAINKGLQIGKSATLRIDQK